MSKLLRKLIKILFPIIVVVIVISLYLFSTYPTNYNNYIVRYSEYYNVDPFLVASIINTESNYDKNATSSKDARGLMQIGPQTGLWASEVLSIEGYTSDMLYDPETNIKIGTWYIDILLKEFNGDLDLMLAAYNAGSGNVTKWLSDKEYSSDGKTLENIPFKETRDYLVKVKKNYKIYSVFYKNHILNNTNDYSSYIDLLNEMRNMLKNMIKNY